MIEQRPSYNHIRDREIARMPLHVEHKTNYGGIVLASIGLIVGFVVCSLVFG